MEKESNNYDNILISQKTLEGMSLNINDRVFFKRIMDRQDELVQDYISETYDHHAKLIINVVKDMLNDQKKEIFLRFDQVEEKIEGLNKKVMNIDCRVEKIERLLSWSNIIIYSVIVLALAGFVAFLIDVLSRIK